MAAQNFIASAIKRPGALTAAVGGKPSQHMAIVKRLAAGSGRTAREARFYENVLKPGAEAAVVNRLKGSK